MKKFRKIIFWLHLASGAIAGIFIFLMCVTGALLSFESNILEFAEREIRVVSVPAENAERLPIQEIIYKIQTGNRTPSHQTLLCETKKLRRQRLGWDAKDKFLSILTRAKLQVKAQKGGADFSA